jgi:hypothetical protein
VIRVTDEPEVPFEGLDAERPLPPELRARLEAALLAAVAGGLPVPADAGGLHQPPGTHTDSLDAPRALPEPLRARLESALLAEAAVSGAAAASPAPPAAAASATTAAGEVVSLASRRRKVVALWSSVAAVLLLVIAVAGLAGRGGNSGSGSLEAAGGPTTTTLETPAPLPSGAGDSTGATSAATTAPVSPTTRATRPRPSPSTTVPLAPGGSTASPPTSPAPTSPEPSGGAPAPVTDPGTPPPFYNSPPPGESAGSAPAMTASPSPSAGSGSQDAAPSNQTQKSATPGSRFRVGIIPGDADQEAGFRAYIDRLNQSGGVSGHGIDLVTVGPSAPAANTIATVNLGSQPVAGSGGAPGWATGPLLETLTATENLLPGNGAVFSFASVPERQGHLAADALFPTEAGAGTKAVIYEPAAPGPLRDTVPAAIEAVLKARNVTVQVVTYDPAAHKPLIPADAAFISLDPAAAKAWVAQAKAEGNPASRVAGIYSLADESLLTDLPEGSRVVSPYVVPGGDEGQAIRSAGAGTPAPVLHGWATAKSLSAALWRTGADTPAEVQSALEGLAGWSSGLAPPYETRSGSRSRTPEGVVFAVQSQAFVAQGGFRRDPY